MSDTITPSLQDAYTALVAFIVSVTGLPESNVIQGLPNRAAMPLPGFVTVQAIHTRRLRTNLGTWDETNPNPTVSSLEQGLELTVQIDCYGPASGDWANMLSTLLRDEAGCTALAPNCQPLYADEARMVPLVDGEGQYEERWSLDARIQMNPVTTIAQQFASAAHVTLIDVEERYPA